MKSYEKIYLKLKNQVGGRIIKIKYKGKIITVDVPDNFFCPLTSELFSDPVIATDGQTYERSKIEELLNDHTSPLPKAVLTDKTLFPNKALKKN